MDERLAFIEEYLPDANLRNNITQEVLLLENKVNTCQLDYDLSTKSALVVASALKRFLFKLKSPLISKDLAESMRLKQGKKRTKIKSYFDFIMFSLFTAKLTGKKNQVTGLVLDINGMSRENRKTLGVLLKMAQKRINYNANSANKDNSLVKLLSSALCQAFYPMGPSPEIANNQLFHGISNTAMNKRNEYELNITPCIEYMITNIGKTFDLRRFDYYIIKLKDSFKKIDPAK